MKNMLTMTVILFILMASMTSRAQAGDAKRFTGLWEGIDPEDGSDEILSITDNGDGTFKLLLYSTYFTLCDGEEGLFRVRVKLRQNSL